jgi:biopolymer transport protein ExbD
LRILSAYETLLHNNEEEDAMRRRHHAFNVPQASAHLPAPEMNTTPLIDVMLVLLIFFIVTIPITSHKVPIDLPQSGSVTQRDPVIHRLTLDRAGALSWDGQAIGDAELPARLAAMKADPAAELHMQTDAEARYDRFDAVLATVKRAGIERLGMVGNAQFAASIG